MRAAVYHGPNDLRVEERPRPRIGADEALLRVMACGICGTDQRIVAGHHRYFPPGVDRIPGHELVGEIVEVGAAVASPLPDGQVFVAPNMGCGHCRQCLSGNNNLCAEFQALGITMDGGFAEYVRIPAPAIAQGNVIALGGNIDPETATLIEPLACVIRGQDPLDIASGETVLIIGSGPIGILHAMLARAKGAGKIIIADRWPERLAMARRMGADVVINARDEDARAVVARETGKLGADVVIVAAPSPDAMAAALDQAALRGRIAWFAGLPRDGSILSVDANTVHYRELRVTGTTACSTLDCRRAADLMREGRLDLSPLVSRRIALSDLPLDFVPPIDKARIKTVMVAGPSKD
ncbi:MAG TPA: alcohol dehydrogenase catalytic domain-containing protein [Bauldia sp.]|nr:alcohol dehydrogenase catalytic domain-containing protein [Bauldia sp.]